MGVRIAVSVAPQGDIRHPLPGVPVSDALFYAMSMFFLSLRQWASLFFFPGRSLMGPGRDLHSRWCRVFFSATCPLRAFLLWLARDDTEAVVRFSGLAELQSSPSGARSFSG